MSAAEYGYEELGFDPYGIDASVSVVSAYAIGERQVRVELAAFPLAQSVIDEGDALNPTTWVVQTSNEQFTVLSVSVVSSSPPVFELYTLQKFASSLIEHEVGSTTLRDGAGYLIGAPYFAPFFGCEANAETETSAGALDFENSPFDTDRPAGTLAVGSNGDYKNHAGLPFLRKLIVRRLTTMPGGLFHLPEYGIGIKLKEPLKSSDLMSLRSDLRKTLLEEPEFSDVSSRLQLFADGRLQIEIRGRLRSNQEVIVPIEARP